MTLESSFEDKLKSAILDDAEQTLRDDLGPALVEVAEQNWRDYASRNDYDIEFIWEDVEGPTIERRGDTIQMQIEWPGLTALFEFGVSPHTIEGNPLLHFYWEAADQWVKTESVDWGSQTGGIPDSRAIRDSLRWMRRQMEAA